MTKVQNEQVIIYESQVFSTKSTQYKLLKEYNIELNDKNPFEELKKINEQIEKPEYKNVTIYEEIKEFEKVKEKIQLNIKNKKFKPLDEENYELIPVYSQKEILTSMIESITNQDIFESITKIKNYTKKHERELEKYKKTIESEVKISEKELEKKRNEILQFKKKILDILEKEIKTEEKILKELEKEKIKQEEMFHLIKEKGNFKLEKKKIEDKKNHIAHKIKKLSLDEKLFKAKITTLKTNLKSKKYKTIEPLPFILSLGLIYWTSFSNTKTIILKYENKINKLKEKEIILEKEHEDLIEKERILTQENIEKLKEITKLEEELQKKIIQIEKNLDKQKRIVDKKYQERKDKEEKYNILINEETTLSNKYIKVSEKMNEIESNELNNIITKIDKLKEKKERQKEELTQLLKNIEKQKIDSKKNCIIEYSL